MKQKNCMDGIESYARDVGECVAAYEAVCATSYPGERSGGCAKMSDSGVKIQNAHGFAFVVHGKGMLQKLKEPDPDTVRAMTALISDEKVLAIVRVLSFGVFLTEAEIAERASLLCEDAERAIIKLLKHGICECNSEGKYTFGAKSYVLFAILAGLYIASPEGYNSIGHLTCSYSVED